jgi:hypothetical protein
MAISRNIEKNTVYLSHFLTGLYTNRALIYTPISAMGIQLIQRMDALADGLNMELSNQLTLVRRPGFPRYSSAAFGSSDWPQNFYSFQNLSGTIYTLVDAPTTVRSFTTGAQTSLLTKGTTAVSRFQTVANQVYWCDGTNAKKWDGTTVTNWGIAAGVSAPGVSLGAGSLSPTVGYSYVYVFRNSTTGHISTASPVSGNTGAQSSKEFTITGSTTTDAQVNKVDIYRTLDGGSVYYYVAEVAYSSSWTYTDNNADATLNTALIAPIADANDPPPTGCSNVCFWQNRLWVIVGNLVYFAAGPDTTNGVGEESFPPANVFKFPSNCTAFAPTSQGLVIFTSDDAYLILGQDSTSFYSMAWQQNYGVKTQDCVSQDGDTVNIFTSKRQLFSISLASGISEIGFNIEDKLLNFNPTASSIAMHRAGPDLGLFISDGSTNIYRFNTAMGSWSPVCQVVNGAGVIKSIETSTGNWTLLTGRTAGSGYILGRSVSTFSDDSNTYDAYGTVGCIVLSPPGEVATVSGIVLERTSAGTDPTLSILLNEVSGTFVALPYPVQDPPLLTASTSIVMKRFYLKSAATPLAQQARFAQIKVDFSTQTVKNEIYGLGVMP